MTRATRCLALATTLVILGPLLPGVAPGAEPSPAFQAGLRRTRELRKERRRVSAVPPVGVIVPYPMPPSLIIRQTPAVHHEIEGLLRLLRSSG